MKDLLQWLKLMVRTNQVPLLVGKPGIGKSDTVEQLARELNRPLITIDANEFDAIDLKGMIDIENKGHRVNARTFYATPSFWPCGQDDNHLLFIDELLTCPPSVQNVLLKLTSDRREIGENRLGDNVRLIAATNSNDDGAHVFDISTPSRDRFWVRELTVDLPTWITWAKANNINPIITSFIEANQTMLHTQGDERLMDPNDSSKIMTPRRWAKLSPLMPELLNNNCNDTLERMVAEQAGEKVSVAFLSHVALVKDLPPLDEILLTPRTAILPLDILTYDLLTKTLVNLCRNGKNRKAVAIYVRRFPGETKAVAINNLLNTHPHMADLFD